MFHYSVPDLPFGGVGRSGMGSYSFGIEGFRRFSHARSVYHQAGPAALMRVLQPPYGRMFDLAVRQNLERLATRYETISVSRPSCRLIEPSSRRRHLRRTEGLASTPKPLIRDTKNASG